MFTGAPGHLWIQIHNSKVGGAAGSSYRFKLGTSCRAEWSLSTWKMCPSVFNMSGKQREQLRVITPINLSDRTGQENLDQRNKGVNVDQSLSSWRGCRLQASLSSETRTREGFLLSMEYNSIMKPHTRQCALTEWTWVYQWLYDVWVTLSNIQACCTRLGTHHQLPVSWQSDFWHG